MGNKPVGVIRKTKESGIPRTSQFMERWHWNMDRYGGLDVQLHKRARNACACRFRRTTICEHVAGTILWSQDVDVTASGPFGRSWRRTIRELVSIEIIEIKPRRCSF
jgi:hypothetical protein